MRSTSRLSRELHALTHLDAAPEPPLSLADVLEEEYSALHPEQRIAHLGAGDRFSADDIADLPGFARALLDAKARTDALREGRVWSPHPPAPRTNAATRIADLIIDGQSDLVAQLPAILVADAAATAADSARVRTLLAERLTSLVPSVVDRASLENAFASFLRTSDDRRLASIIGQIHDAEHAALCLSGGGIRSASFAMGVVQGLARRGVLSRFHYLSTVSGGGYTGSWLSAWMARAGAEHVNEQLAGARSAKTDAEPAPVRHIRSFSAYLNPSFGLLSADTWTLLATIARNILLMWVVMLPVMAAALMVPRFLVALPMTTLRGWNEYGIDPADLMAFLTVGGTILAVAAIAFVQRHLYSDGAADGDDKRFDRPVTVQRFLSRCLLPLVVAMLALAQAWEMMWSMMRYSPEEAKALAIPLSRRAWTEGLILADPARFNATALSVIMGIEFWVTVYVIAWAVSARGRRYRAEGFLLAALSGVFAGAIGGFGSARLFGLVAWLHQPEFFATFAVPMSLFGLLVSKQLVVGLGSRRMSDASRESNARFSAWLLIAIVSWIGIVGLALCGPLILGWAVGATRQLIGVSGITGVAAALLAASRRTAPAAGANAPRTQTGKLQQLLQRAAIGVATPLFAATVIVLISVLDGEILKRLCAGMIDWCPMFEPRHAPRYFLGHVRTMSIGDFAAPQLVIFAVVGLAVIAYVLGRLVDTNRFSLHAMYRTRLVRTFLGASKAPGERQANPFTGFDETDDMPMSDLWPANAGAHAENGPRAAKTPPLHVVNLTLNTVAGTNLATQSRKASPFTVTSLHAGCASVGYRRTSKAGVESTTLYGGADGISLGTAMAISGAAASPNAGYHSSPVVTFLMTLFNARLGWWLGNPGAPGARTFSDDEPKLGLVPILEEMFGRTTDHSPYVYLSDGGHFENLGLYEMVRRRCRFIVVSDAGADPAAAFDDLGGAIRKIRIDFGISIEFQATPLPIHARSDDGVPPGARYWAIGRIGYSRVDGELAGTGHQVSDGILVYIKPAYYGCEPADVFNYGVSTPDFPHESTGNQFFGEAQFESYRALGAYAVDEMFRKEFDEDNSGTGKPGRTLADWFGTRNAGIVAAPPPTQVSVAPVMA